MWVPAPPLMVHVELHSMLQAGRGKLHDRHLKQPVAAASRLCLECERCHVGLVTAIGYVAALGRGGNGPARAAERAGSAEYLRWSSPAARAGAR